MWNRNANSEYEKLKYGMNKSNTYVGLGMNETRDVEITGKLTPGLDVINIKENEYSKITTPLKTGKRTMIRQDDETDVWF